MAFIPIPDLTLLSTPELRDVVASSLPDGFTLRVTEAPPWRATIERPDGTTEWETLGVDPRILLFDVYGHILLAAGATPRHPAWRRRGEIVVPERYGVRSYQGDVKVDEPEDLNPTEIEELYGIKRSRS